MSYRCEKNRNQAEIRHHPAPYCPVKERLEYQMTLHSMARGKGIMMNGCTIRWSRHGRRTYV